jgi:hypothetical protein
MEGNSSIYWTSRQSRVSDDDATEISRRVSSIYLPCQISLPYQFSSRCYAQLATTRQLLGFFPLATNPNPNDMWPNEGPEYYWQVGPQTHVGPNLTQTSGSPHTLDAKPGLVCLTCLAHWSGDLDEKHFNGKILFSISSACQTRADLFPLARYLLFQTVPLLPVDKQRGDPTTRLFNCCLTVNVRTSLPTIAASHLQVGRSTGARGDMSV